MPRKSKKRKQKRITAPNLRGKGGLREWYTSARQWSQGPGRPLMEAGRTLLDQFFPGAGAVSKRIMNLLGWGAYKGARNTILEASPVPTIHAMPDRGVRVIHKEFLGQVSSSVNFSTTTYPINPGIPSTFPWLAGVANNFQKYKLNGLIFYFKSTAAQVAYSTNNALGTVVGVTQYNVYDPQPVSLNQVLNIAGVMEEKPTRDCIFPVECDRFHAIYPAMFVRDKSVSDDLAKYDPGKFQLCTSGSQAAAVVGQLWVAYDVTLIQPIPAALSTGDVPTGGSLYYLSGEYTTGNPLGSSVLISDNLIDGQGGSILMTDSVTTIPPPRVPARIVVQAFWTVNPGSWVAPTVSDTNLTEVYSGFAISAGTITYSGIFEIDDPSLSSTLTMSGGTAPAAPTITSGFFSVVMNPVGTTFSNAHREETKEDEGILIACGSTSSALNPGYLKPSVSLTSPQNTKQNKNSEKVSCYKTK